MDEKNEKKLEKKMVKFQWNGLAMSTLAYKNSPNRTILPTKTIELDLCEKYDLRHIIEILKTINSPSNEQTKVTTTPHGKIHESLYYKWQIIEGEQYIPEQLRKIKNDENDFYDESLKATIETLVPDYFKQEIREIKVRVR